MRIESENPSEVAARPDGRLTRIAIRGMNCQGCVGKVREGLTGLQGVASAEVVLEPGSATVRWRAGTIPNPGELVEAIRKAGFQAEALAGEAPAAQVRRLPFLSGWKFNVVVGGAATVPLMVAEWFFGAGMERWYQWLAFALVLPVQVLCGARFYRGAWSQLRVGSSNMDTLVALGSTTAFAYSVWGLFSGWHQHLFFMEAASIITLISVGHWVESLVSAKSESSLRKLLQLAPQKARLLDGTGAEKEIPVSQLRVGDNVRIKPGDRIPTDGEVVDGVSTVDESMLTGESMPVEKSRGGALFAGTVNINGMLQARVTATGETTALAHIIEVVRRAQSSRANIQRLGDRVSSVFVPIVIMVALATGFWWALAPESAMVVGRWFEGFLWPAHHPAGALASAIYHAAAVLIIACPCAMGLATPVAIMAGANVASERGILIRDGIALEKTGRLNAILFDKTGTLTHGRMTVAAHEDHAGTYLNGRSSGEIAAAIAKGSQHPLSVAVSQLSEVDLPVKDWEEVPGSGVQARFKDSGSDAVFRLGSLHWLKGIGVELSPGADFAQHWSAQGASILGLSRDRQLAALFALRDSIKPNAAEVVADLSRLGKTVYLVTGDNKLTALAIAQQAGVDAAHVFSEVRPEEKAGIVLRLQQEGKRVAFVGDGINDAPALEQADLGIAVSRASDVAKEAADIILLRADLKAIPEALQLAQATLRTIKQNLFWAFFYNAAAVPLAMFGFVSPIVSALAMGLSDLMVIGNALRLRRWRYDPR